MKGIQIASPSFICILKGLTMIRIDFVFTAMNSIDNIFDILTSKGRRTGRLQDQRTGRFRDQET